SLFAWANGKQGLAVFDRLSVGDQHFDYFTGDVRLNLIHQLHGFNNAQNLPCRHLVSRFDERQGTRRRSLIKGAYDRGFYLVQFFLWGGRWRGGWRRNRS